MKRIIVDYKKLTADILSFLAEEYPLGVKDSDIITFRNSKNETIEAVQVKSKDTVYLVKVGVKLDKALQDFIEDDYEFDMDIHFNNY